MKKPTLIQFKHLCSNIDNILSLSRPTSLGVTLGFATFIILFGNFLESWIKCRFSGTAQRSIKAIHVIFRTCSTWLLLLSFTFQLISKLPECAWQLLFMLGLFLFLASGFIPLAASLSFIFNLYQKIMGFFTKSPRIFQLRFILPALISLLICIIFTVEYEYLFVITVIIIFLIVGFLTIYTPKI